MKTNSLVLLRTMYISSSKINVLKNSKDKNKIRSVKTAFAGYFLLSLYLFYKQDSSINYFFSRKCPLV